MITALSGVAACSCSTPTYGSSSGGGGGPGPNQVFMQGLAFSPTTRTITVGSTVQWVNQDGVGHTVNSSSGPDSAFASGTVAASGSYSHTFTVAGTYQYYCTIHGTPTSGMHATIVVQ